MNKKEKLHKLKQELQLNEDRYKKMLTEFSETRAGSAYGVEYFEIQLKVLEEMIRNTKTEIIKIKSSD